MHENIVHQMAGKLTNDSRLPKNLTNCPTTNIDVQGDDGTSFLIPDGQVTWWRCSACQGWHVLIVDYMKKVRAVSNTSNAGNYSFLSPE